MGYIIDVEILEELKKIRELNEKLLNDVRKLNKCRNGWKNE